MESPRDYFFYVSDDGDVIALRVRDYKLAFELQNAVNSNVWAEPFVKLRVPHLFHLRRDPFERADFNSQIYWKWAMDHIPYLYLAQAIVQHQIDDFVKFPPRQKAASFNLDSVMAQLRPAIEAEKAKEAASERHTPEPVRKKAS